MNTKSLLPLFALLLSPLAGAETTIASFSGDVPVTPGWKVMGDLPLTAITDGETRAVEFKDESETKAAELVYRLTEEQAIEVVSHGFTMVARVRHISNGATGSNFRVLLRVPGYSSVQLSTYGDAEATGARLSSYDSVTKIPVSIPLPGAGLTYVAIKAVFRPGAKADAPGSLEVFFDDKSIFTIGVARATSMQAMIQIGGAGGGAAVRTGRDLVSELRVTTP